MEWTYRYLIPSVTLEADVACYWWIQWYVTTGRLWARYQRYGAPSQRSFHIEHIILEISWPFTGLVWGIPISRVLIMAPYRVPFLPLGSILIYSLLPVGGSGGYRTDIQRRDYPLAWDISVILWSSQGVLYHLPDQVINCGYGLPVLRHMAIGRAYHILAILHWHDVACWIITILSTVQSLLPWNVESGNWLHRGRLSVYHPWPTACMHCIEISPFRHYNDLSWLLTSWYRNQVTSWIVPYLMSWGSSVVASTIDHCDDMWWWYRHGRATW